MGPWQLGVWNLNFTTLDPSPQGSGSSSPCAQRPLPSHPAQLLVSWAASARPSSLWLRSFANLGYSHKAGGGCHLFTGLKMHCGDPERKGVLWEAAAPRSGFVIIHLLVSTECASGSLLCSSLLHMPAAWINGGQQIKPAPGGAEWAWVHPSSLVLLQGIRCYFLVVFDFNNA